MKNFKLSMSALGLMLVSLGASAAAGPYDAITDAVDFGDVLVVVGVVAAAIAAVYVFIKGAKLAIAAIRGA